MIATIPLKKEKRKANKTQFRAEIVFGRPSVDCEDIGICRMSLLGKKKLESCEKCKQKKVESLITIFDGGHIEFTFLKEILNPALYQKYLSNAFFIIKELFYFEENDYSFSIPVGPYPICEEEYFVKIVFNY
ncbi:MAG: hypothetical protein AB8G86_30405 [Saprospiraceae bacterium]